MATFRYPNSPVFYRRLMHAYPLAVRGAGCWLYDAARKEYLDACGGAFVASLGHGVADIAEAIARQARRLAYVNGTAFTHEPVEQLAAEIARRSPPGLDKVYVLSSGSEAVEAALKLARQYWVERGKREKHVVIALRPSYHGNTLLALSASAREHYRTYFHDWLVDVRRVPAPYPYRCCCGGDEAGCPVCCGDALERAILDAGPDTVAAFIAEPVGGSSTGASVPRADYFRRIRDICEPLRGVVRRRRGFDRGGADRHLDGARAIRRRPRSHDSRQGARRRGSSRCPSWWRRSGSSTPWRRAPAA